MLYGYARVSTNGQARDGNSLDAQVHALKNAGAEIIFSDVFSGSKNNRPQLDKLLKVIENGDTLIITKLDRIARSLIQGIQLLETLSNKGVIIDVLNMSIIDNSPTGKLIRNIMLFFSEFERDMILQRTTEGKAIAKQNRQLPRRPSQEIQTSTNQSRTGITANTLIQAGCRHDWHQRNDNIPSETTKHTPELNTSYDSPHPIPSPNYSAFIKPQPQPPPHIKEAIYSSQNYPTYSRTSTVPPPYSHPYPPHLAPNTPSPHFHIPPHNMASF